MSQLQTLPRSHAVSPRPESTAPVVPQRRDESIDVLRGLAIFTMIAANLAAPLLAEPHPLWFRLYGSFAAPIFVTLSGMMVAAGTRSKGYPLRRFIVRGAVLLALAALLDVFLWDSYPFLSVDVLYLLGVSLPLAYLATRLSGRARWSIVAAILIATPLLQAARGYAEYPKEVSFIRGSRAALAPADFVDHWLIDGWFPLFPWLSFAIFGVELASLRARPFVETSRWRRTSLWYGLAVATAGAAAWWTVPHDVLVRAGYSELFYPPTTGFVLTAGGVAVALLAAIDRNPRRSVYKPFGLLGTAALTIYVAHLILIQEVATRIVSDVQWGGFCTLYACITLAMFVVARAERAIKVRWRSLAAGSFRHDVSAPAHDGHRES